MVLNSRARSSCSQRCTCTLRENPTASCSLIAPSQILLETGQNGIVRSIIKLISIYNKILGSTKRWSTDSWLLRFVQSSWRIRLAAPEYTATLYHRSRCTYKGTSTWRFESAFITLCKKRDLNLVGAGVKTAASCSKGEGIPLRIRSQ